jgi:hypothetical protein
MDQLNRRTNNLGRICRYCGTLTHVAGGPAPFPTVSAPKPEDWHGDASCVEVVEPIA